jgi:hypothetical protein
MGTAKAFGWVTLVAGVWEILAPFIIGYSSVTGPTTNAIILGIVLGLFGLWVALSKSASTVRTLSWVNAILGAWLIVAPFIINYGGKTGPLVNDIIVGVVVAVLEVWGAVSAGKTA